MGERYTKKCSLELLLVVSVDGFVVKSIVEGLATDAVMTGAVSSMAVHVVDSAVKMAAAVSSVVVIESVV